MKKILIIFCSLAFLTLFVMTSCSDQPKETEQRAIPSAETSNSSVELDLNAIKEQSRMPDEVNVSIAYDPFFHMAKTYRAYSLKALIEPYLKKLDIHENPGSDAVVTFYCTDGYQPTLQLSELLAGEGFLAFRDEDVSAKEQYWTDSLKVKFPPFYLVWQNVSKENQSLPWPYGLYKIRIDKVDTIYDAIYPINHDKAINGFNQFRDNCIKCHSINKLGGNVGPEFNFPKNITDYWEVENMWNYVKNPQSFRYNARMNPITSLTRDEFDEIIEYLRYVRSVKPLPDAPEKTKEPN